MTTSVMTSSNTSFATGAVTPDIDPEIDLEGYMMSLGRAAREAATALRLTSSAVKTQALTAMAAEIRTDADGILTANAQDMETSTQNGLSAAMLDRLKLNPDRVEAIAQSLLDIAALPDPVGQIDEQWTQPNGLKFSKVRVPISQHSSRAIHAALTRGLSHVGLPETAIQMIATTDRAAVGYLLGGIDAQVDLIIPRGGKNLIARVQKDARVPVLAHLEGLCHSYVHSAADIEKAVSIICNAKLRRIGVCGSTETLLIDTAIAADALPRIAKALQAQGCELRGDAGAQAVIPACLAATDADYFTEHLAAILNIRCVGNIVAAMAHISHYGSGHTDCIITEDQDAAERFLRDVDSAIVIHNASTQYADGGEFGFGAEIGIATGRLHARGPVGAQHLTTYKYRVEGNGQVRPE